MDTRALRNLRLLLRQEFLKQVELAQDEDDLDELAEIAIDCLASLPTRVIRVDCYDRASVRCNIPDENITTQFVDAVMDRYCPEFNYDSENDYIGELAEELKGDKIEITEI